MLRTTAISSESLRLERSARILCRRPLRRYEPLHTPRRTRVPGCTRMQACAEAPRTTASLLLSLCARTHLEVRFRLLPRVCLLLALHPPPHVVGGHSTVPRQSAPHLRCCIAVSRLPIPAASTSRRATQATSCSSGRDSNCNPFVLLHAEPSSTLPFGCRSAIGCRP